MKETGWNYSPKLCPVLPGQPEPGANRRTAKLVSLDDFRLLSEAREQRVVESACIIPGALLDLSGAG